MRLRSQAGEVVSAYRKAKLLRAVILYGGGFAGGAAVMGWFAAGPLILGLVVGVYK